MCSQHLCLCLKNKNWEKIPNSGHCLEKSSQFQKFFGKVLIGKKYSWKNIQLEISSHFWRTFPLGKISLEKISFGKIFSWKKIPLEKISLNFKSLDINTLQSYHISSRPQIKKTRSFLGSEILPNTYFSRPFKDKSRSTSS